ncbi:RNA polymerase sigma-70 factor [Pedobacter nyackensis]|uniref:RNA polymerase sigma factor n=1 Tax=Pedobacter nyackensis TaxID=475255 RepID=UPI00292E989A|nr:RNA polymerase sigma-70 factor [Pedobacter nyackensis]
MDKIVGCDFSKEERLLQELSEGNPKAFESLYLQYRTIIYGSVFKLVKSHEFTQDIVQDVLLKIWQNRNKLASLKNFKSYLFTITQNTVYDHFRKVASNQNKIEKVLEIIAEQSANDIEETIFYHELQNQLGEILAIMPEKCRQVFILCKLEGKSYNEVAQLLNISNATINNHIVKATRIIKENWSSTEYHMCSLRT